MIPGPVKLSQRVLNAMTHQMINHKSFQFSKLYSQCQESSSKFFNSKPENTYIINGSGTSGMDASINCSAEKKNTVLCISNGKFGNRFQEISQKYCNVINLNFEWGKCIDINKVKFIIEQNDLDIITMVHSETSTGLLNPIK